jgi:hypothetical protein
VCSLGPRHPETPPSRNSFTRRTQLLLRVTPGHTACTARICRSGHLTRQWILWTQRGWRLHPVPTVRLVPRGTQMSNAVQRNDPDRATRQCMPQ